MLGTIVGNIDLAMVSLVLFTVFFFGLVVYLQMENSREGFPLEDDKGGSAPNPGLFPAPSPKTFKLPHGLGDVTVPSGDTDRDRSFAMEQTNEITGMPFVPTGNPLVDGVGPAAWAERRDAPELDGHGHPKIVPMRTVEAFSVSAGRDPRGLPVHSADGEVVGTVSDMWIDGPEHLVRYLEFDLAGDAGSRLVPIQLANIKSNSVAIHALHSPHFSNIPQHKSSDQVTLLEEEKICAYYCGGKLYSSEDRLETQI
ncbi:MAG: photosynthetic reaction center subunit H [Pseudomonadota bacterium]